jgi:hypothetical protein
MNEIQSTVASSSVSLSLPLSQTILLRTNAVTSDTMTVTLPTLSANERGLVFTFIKVFDTTNNLNFNVFFNTTGNPIFTSLVLVGNPTTNNTLLSLNKLQTKIAVGFFENIEGVNTAAIRANNYGAKPKIAVSRFGDPGIEASLLALCERVSKS